MEYADGLHHSSPISICVRGAQCAEWKQVIYGGKGLECLAFSSESGKTDAVWRSIPDAGTRQAVREGCRVQFRDRLTKDSTSALDSGPQRFTCPYC